MSKAHKKFRDELHKIAPYTQYRKEYCEKCGVKKDPKAIYDKDGFLIRKGHRGFLTVHHIDLNPLNNKPENLQTLCRPCHDKIHNI